MTHHVKTADDLRSLPYNDYQRTMIVRFIEAMDTNAQEHDCEYIQDALIGLMEGEGAPEDNKAVQDALRGMGLCPAATNLVHGCLVNLLSKQMVEASKAQESLHTFLDAAAGDGLILDGVDSADLYIKMFPERYAAALKKIGI